MRNTIITVHAEVCGVHPFTRPPLLPMATCADNSPVMSLNRSLAQGPTAHDDHPFARAKRHQRLLLQELGVRASVSILILVFAEVLTASLGLAVSPIIRLAALKIGRAHV